jgi:hypothetical protein
LDPHPSFIAPPLQGGRGNERGVIRRKYLVSSKTHQARTL